MSGDLARVDRWIYQVLTADAQLAGLVGTRIYADLAPQGVTGEVVIFAFLGGADKFQTLNSDSRSTNAIYLVRAIAQSSSYDAVRSAADRIDALLQVPTQGSLVDDVLITGVRREQPHQRKDLANGVPYVYLGGFYRILYQQS
jgi:hypothetical protein